MVAALARSSLAVALILLSAHPCLGFGFSAPMCSRGRATLGGSVYSSSHRNAPHLGRGPAVRGDVGLRAAAEGGGMPDAGLRKLLAGSNIWIIGLDGCGKDKIGEDLAKSLGYRFVNTNEIISQLVKAPVDDALIEQVGEEQWRQIERSVLDQVQAYVRTVVTTGSMAPLDTENWAKFRTGVVVYTHAEGSALREEGVQGPASNEAAAMMEGLGRRERLPLLLAQRETLYRQADITVVVDDGDAPPAARDKISEALRAFIEENPALDKPKLSEGHAQALSRIMDLKDDEKDRRPAGADVPREQINKLNKMLDEVEGTEGGPEAPGDKK